MQRMTVRLPDELKQWVLDQAKKKGRTMNGEIVELIRRLKEKDSETQKAA